MLRILPLLLVAFKIWMVVDASKRNAPYHWFLIILMVPGGGVVYFFMVKAKDIDTKKWARMFKGPTTLKELRHNYAETPSLNNKTSLAQGLYDANESAEAIRLFGEVLHRDERNEAALHGLGLSQLAAKNYRGAIDPLEKLVALNPAYHDYVAWPDLAWAHHELGERTQELAILRELVKSSSMIKHTVFLAQELVDAGESAEAHQLLDTALMAHERSPSYVKKRNREWARKARRILKGS
ncbi:MAG: hypothetical protein JRH20_10090 [Deltaproteobacteria bacterium]|nr:hypothetical protein [Deltaproteobacteria bacterium]